MAIYERTQKATVRKLVGITDYPMHSVATLEDGEKIALTGNCMSRKEHPKVGGYYVEEGYVTFFLSEESLNKNYRPVQSEATA
jgi:hypothetical protein